MRRNLSDLAYALLRARTDRIARHIDALFGPTVDQSLPVANADLVRRSKPILSLQGLCNWVHREGHKDAADELTELRSELPRRWLAELRRIIQEESSQ